MSKSLVKNAGFHMLYKLFNILFALITSMYIARILSPAGVGQVAYAQNIMTYFFLLASLGIPNYGTREIAKSRDDKAKNQQIFSELFFINFWSTVLFAACYFIFVTWNEAFRGQLLLHYVVGLNLVLNIFNIEWFYQGHEEYQYITVRSFFVKLLAFVLVILFVRDRGDTVIYALIASFAVVGNYIFNFIHLRKYIRIQTRGLKLFHHFKPILVLFASTIAVELYTLLDTTMLGIFTNDTIVGYYTNSTKTVKIITTLVSAISAVLLPRLSYYLEKGQQAELKKVVGDSVKILMWLTLACSFGLFFTADEATVIMFGEAYAPAAAITKIMCSMIFSIGLNFFFGSQILITFGKEKFLLISVVCGAILNMGMNLFLIPRYQAEGAALASAASETLVLILTYVFASRYVSFQVERSFLVSEALSIAALIVGVFVGGCIAGPKIFILAAKVILGGCGYIGVGILTKNAVALQFLQFFMKKMKKI